MTIDESEWLFMVLQCDESLNLLSLWLCRSADGVINRRRCNVLLFSDLIRNLLMILLYSPQSVILLLDEAGKIRQECVWIWRRWCRILFSRLINDFDFCFGVDGVGPTIGGEAASGITLFTILGEPLVSFSSCPTSVRIGIKQSCKVWTVDRIPAVVEVLLLVFIFRVPIIILKTKRWLLNCYGGGTCNRKRLRLRGA